MDKIKAKPDIAILCCIEQTALSTTVIRFANIGAHFRRYLQWLSAQDRSFFKKRFVRLSAHDPAPRAPYPCRHYGDLSCDSEQRAVPARSRALVSGERPSLHLGLGHSIPLRQTGRGCGRAGRRRRTGPGNREGLKPAGGDSIASCGSRGYNETASGRAEWPSGRPFSPMSSITASL